MPALAFAVISIAILFLASTVLAATLLNPFTQTELDTNWEADRFFPTDGVTSVSAFGRDDVARLGLDSTQTQAGTFQRTEGIKTVGVQNFGTMVQADLYIDPDWQDKAVRAGLWVVGDDGAGARDDWFGIVEFVNNEPCPDPDCSNQANLTDHEGFRIWDSAVGWTQNLNTSFTYGEWVTLAIELDTANQEYHYYIDGVLVGSATAGENFIREIFLNSYNYGLDSFPTLGSESYAAHWHVGIPVPPPAPQNINSSLFRFDVTNRGSINNTTQADSHTGQNIALGSLGGLGGFGGSVTSGAGDENNGGAQAGNGGNGGSSGAGGLVTTGNASADANTINEANSTGVDIGSECGCGGEVNGLTLGVSIDNDSPIVNTTQGRARTGQNLSLGSAGGNGGVGGNVGGGAGDENNGGASAGTGGSGGAGGPGGAVGTGNAGSTSSTLNLLNNTLIRVRF